MHLFQSTLEALPIQMRNQRQRSDEYQHGAAEEFGAFTHGFAEAVAHGEADGSHNGGGKADG